MLWYTFSRMVDIGHGVIDSSILNWPTLIEAYRKGRTTLDVNPIYLSLSDLCEKYCTWHNDLNTTGLLAILYSICVHVYPCPTVIISYMINNIVIFSKCKLPYQTITDAMRLKNIGTLYLVGCTLPILFFFLKSFTVVIACLKQL